MTTHKRVDVRIKDKQLIFLLTKMKEQNPGLSYEQILKMWYDAMNNNGTSQLKNRFDELHDYSTMISSNNEFHRLINLLGQIATFKPIMDSPKKCKVVCDDVENLLIAHFKNFRGDTDL